MADPPDHPPALSRDEDSSARIPALLAIFVGAGAVLGLLAGNGVSIPGIGADARATAATDAATGPVASTVEGDTGSDPATAPRPTAVVAAPIPAGSAVTITASQATVILAGVVPSQALAEELVGRAGAIYAADQLQNQLAVDAGAHTPIVVNITGSTTDQALFDRLTTGFVGIVGIETINTEGLKKEESGELERALLALPPIQFESGAAIILPDSAPALDQVVSLLVDNPATTIEIGGHTDSRGSSESNRSLSHARAEAVVSALSERGLVNRLVARGFGESRLAVNPDDSPDAQQANRRIEFRVL
jgi:outer membrane protein OmpA-like peptidoglycan-associated protein